MVSASQPGSKWTLPDGRAADAQALGRRPRVRSLRGLARQADPGTFAELTRRLDARQAACGCAAPQEKATTWTSSANLPLPPRWQWRRADPDPSLLDLPEGWEWRAVEPVKLEPDLGNPDPAGEAPTTKGPTCRFALNQPNFYEHEKGKERRYGPVDQLVEDMRALDVQVVRHPGRLQLMLDEVLTGGRGELPVSLLDEDHMRSTIADSEALRGLLDLATELRARGVEFKLLLTLVTLGGGSAAGSVDDGEHFKPVPLSWEEGFKDQVIVDDRTVDSGSPRSYPFNRLPLQADGSLSAWDKGTLDPANPFKRLFCRQFARLVGEWLDSNAAALSPYLEGVEICNEVDVRNVRRKSVGTTTLEVADAGSWGQMYFDCASGLAETCDWVPLWLPGIASYAVDDGSGSSMDWSGKRNFLQDMLRQIASLNATDGDRFSMEELIAGVDYHYYHRDPLDRRRLLFLALELGELRRLLNFELTDDENAESGVLLTVTESTINVLCADEEHAPIEAEYESGCETASTGHADPSPDHRPPRYLVWSDITVEEHAVAPANDFQGAMVWMRAAAAMVGGANIVGWHTLMGRPPGAGSFFAGTGLRVDTLLGSSDISTAVARPSWFAFRRMVAVMRTVTAVRLVWPEAPTRDSLKASLSSGALDPSHLVWVVELQSPSRPVVASFGPRPLDPGAVQGWGYLLFIDGVPGLEAEDQASTPSGAEVTFRALGSPEVYLVPTAPSSCVTWPADTDRFPVQVWTADPTEHLSGTHSSGGHGGSSLARTWTIRVGLGQWPRLLWSTTPLDLQSVSVVGTT